VVRLPLWLPTPPKLEGTRYPEVAGVKADDVPASVEDAAVPGPCAAQRDGHDVACGHDAIPSRAHDLILPHKAII
jgi:hypothetical protein